MLNSAENTFQKYEYKDSLVLGSKALKVIW